MNEQGEARRSWRVEHLGRHAFMLLFFVPLLAGVLWLAHPLLGLAAVAVSVVWVVDNALEARRLRERERHGRAS